MHVLNRPGVSVFASFTFNEFFSRSRYNKDRLQALAELVAKRSQGVLLWARFTVYEMISGLTQGEEPDSELLNESLDGMPKELEDIYTRIIRKLSPRARGLAVLV